LLFLAPRRSLKGVTVANLTEEWAELLARRPEFRETLAVYGELIACWVGWPADRPAAGHWSAAACRGPWERGVPLLAESRPALGADDLEETLGLAMEQLASVREDLVPALRRLAEAWDRGASARRRSSRSAGASARRRSGS
jgi:hypothetical protein